MLIKNSPLYYFIRSKEYRTFVWLLLRYGRVPRYVPRDIHFLKYHFLVPDCASFIWQFKEIFVEQIYQFKTNTSDPVIYDCGANIGTSCLYFKNLYPHAKIKAFEADPQIFAILKKNLTANGISDVDVFNQALWSSKGTIDFGADGADGGSIYQQGRSKIQVEAIRLRDLLEKEDQIDLLKIDIEGAEFEVITSCAESLEKVRNLFVEYHSWNDREQKLGQLLNILTERGYRYYFQNIDSRKSPFINRGQGAGMDFQLNIFAYHASEK